MKTLDIKIHGTDAKSYQVKIGSDFLADIMVQLQADFNEYSLFIVTDENLVRTGHLKKLLGSRSTPAFVISPAGENSKNIDTVIAIISQMEKAFFGRDTLVVGLGGGIVGDIAGFAASIFKRGVPVVHIPTTTVAQADSSIGGKTGVDSKESKNAFGTFWHPAAVFIDVAVLKTLPDREYYAGLVESVKHALIADRDYFEFLENNIDNILRRNAETLQKIACFNTSIKGGIVETDPNEKNMRRILNYGHTIGHAVETASNFELLHGQAVAIGIIAAGLIEVELGLGQMERVERIKKILQKLDVPVLLPRNLAENDVMEIMKHDKKAVKRRPKFVLIDQIGKVHCQNGQYAVDVPQDTVEKVLKKLY